MPEPGLAADQLDPRAQLGVLVDVDPGARPGSRPCRGRRPPPGGRRGPATRGAARRWRRRRRAGPATAASRRRSGDRSSRGRRRRRRSPTATPPRPRPRAAIRSPTLSPSTNSAPRNPLSVSPESMNSRLLTTVACTPTARSRANALGLRLPLERVDDLLVPEQRVQQLVGARDPRGEPDQAVLPRASARCPARSGWWRWSTARRRRRARAAARAGTARARRGPRPAGARARRPGRPRTAGRAAAPGSVSWKPTSTPSAVAIAGSTSPSVRPPYAGSTKVPGVTVDVSPGCWPRGSRRTPAAGRRRPGRRPRS